MSGSRVTAATVKKWEDEGIEWEERWERVRAARTTADRFRGLFEARLDLDDPKPSREAYSKLAADFAYFREADRPDRLIEEQAERHREATALAEGLRFAIDHWAKRETDEFSDSRLHRIAEMLDSVAVRSVRYAPARPARGQPIADWHRYARELAKLVQDVLKDAGYRKSINPRYENSRVALICADLLNEMFDSKKEITARSFATAMRRRNQKAGQPRSFEERFPEAARITRAAAKAGL